MGCPHPYGGLAPLAGGLEQLRGDPSIRRPRLGPASKDAHGSPTGRRE
ncbi:hypothetical protein [Halalkalicoccus salilacus]